MTDLRYPIGKFVRQDSYSSAELSGFLQTLETLPAQLRAAVTGLSEAQLETPYRDGGWTVRQLVHHIADSHINSYVRFKLALTEDAPIIKPYDEAAWALLEDSKLPIETSLVLLEVLHLRLTTMLKSCSSDQLQRTFVHPVSGATTLATAMGLYAWHSWHHLEHILALRVRQNW